MDAVLTELAGVAEAPTESVHAWALDYDEYESAARRFAPRRVTAAALAGCLVLMAAAGVVGLLVIRGHMAPAPPTRVTVAAPTIPTISTTPTTARAQPLPPPTVTVTVQAPTAVQAPPPAGITVEQIAAYDQQFVTNLQARGWRVFDSLAITQQAHQVCAALQRGAAPQVVGQQLVGPATPPADAQSFVTTAMLTYPGCP